MRVRTVLLCVRLGAGAYIFFSERSTHKMMGKVALLGLVVACGLGGAAAQVSTADLCPFSLLVRCCGAGDGDARARWS